MNIFFTNKLPYLAASDLANVHLSKMQLETAQLISTAFAHSVVCNHQLLDCYGIDLAMQLAYKSTHRNHPSAIWTRSSNANLLWLLKYAKGMDIAWRARQLLQGRPETSHKSYQVSKVLGKFLLAYCNQVDLYTVRKDGEFDPEALTPVPLCMPEQYWPEPGTKLVPMADAVQAYRSYYIGEKLSIAKWPPGCEPSWLPGSYLAQQSSQVLQGA